MEMDGRVAYIFSLSLTCKVDDGFGIMPQSVEIECVCVQRRLDGNSDGKLTNKSPRFNEGYENNLFFLPPSLLIFHVFRPNDYAQRYIEAHINLTLP